MSDERMKGREEIQNVLTKSSTVEKIYLLTGILTSKDGKPSSHEYTPYYSMNAKEIDTLWKWLHASSYLAAADVIEETFSKHALSIPAESDFGVARRKISEARDSISGNVMQYLSSIGIGDAEVSELLNLLRINVSKNKLIHLLSCDLSSKSELSDLRHSRMGLLDDFKPDFLKLDDGFTADQILSNLQQNSEHLSPISDFVLLLGLDRNIDFFHPHILEMVLSKISTEDFLSIFIYRQLPERLERSIVEAHRYMERSLDDFFDGGPPLGRFKHGQMEDPSPFPVWMEPNGSSVAHIDQNPTLDKLLRGLLNKTLNDISCPPRGIVADSIIRGHEYLTTNMDLTSENLDSIMNDERMTGLLMRLFFNSAETLEAVSPSLFSGVERDRPNGKNGAAMKIASFFLNQNSISDDFRSFSLLPHPFFNRHKNPPALPTALSDPTIFEGSVYSRVAQTYDTNGQIRDLPQTTAKTLLKRMLQLISYVGPEITMKLFDPGMEPAHVVKVMYCVTYVLRTLADGKSGIFEKPLFGGVDEYGGDMDLLESLQKRHEAFTSHEIISKNIKTIFSSLLDEIALGKPSNQWDSIVNDLTIRQMILMTEEARDIRKVPVDVGMDIDLKNIDLPKQASNKDGLFQKMNFKAGRQRQRDHEIRLKNDPAYRLFCVVFNKTKIDSEEDPDAVNSKIFALKKVLHERGLSQGAWRHLSNNSSLSESFGLVIATYLASINQTRIKFQPLRMRKLDDLLSRKNQIQIEDEIRQHAWVDLAFTQQMRLNSMPTFVAMEVLNQGMATDNMAAAEKFLGKMADLSKSFAFSRSYNLLFQLCSGVAPAQTRSGFVSSKSKFDAFWLDEAECVKKLAPVLIRDILRHLRDDGDLSKIEDIMHGCSDMLSDPVNDDLMLRVLRSGSPLNFIKNEHERWISEKNLRDAMANPEAKETWNAEIGEVCVSGYVFRELSTGLALLMEGKEMAHCVGSYIGSCVQGRSRIFNGKSLTTGETMTLELHPFPSSAKDTASPDGRKVVKRWSVAQNRGSRNKTISSEASKAGETFAALYSSVWENNTKEIERRMNTFAAVTAAQSIQKPLKDLPAFNLENLGEPDENFNQRRPRMI